MTFTFRTMHLLIATAIIAALLAIGGYIYSGVANEQRIVQELEGRGWSIGFIYAHSHEPAEEHTFWFCLWNDPHYATATSDAAREAHRDVTLLSSLPGMERIEFDAADLDASDIEKLAQLPGLRYLDVESANLSREAFAALPRLLSLDDLRVNSEGRTEADWLAIASIPKLDHLRPTFGCDDKALAVLAKSQSLNSIFLRLDEDPSFVGADPPVLRPITASGLRRLQAAPSLTKLVLVDSRLTDEVVEVLLQWPQLAELTLHDCRASAEHMQKLRGRRDLKVWAYGQIFGDASYAHVVSPNPE